jgi:Flp pilus assembly protein CpaB
MPMAPHAKTSARPRPAAPRGEPFADAGAAWFWALSALKARHDGVRGGGFRIVRPCDPDDVVVAVERLHRAGRLDAAHLRVLQAWGARGVAPDAMLRGDRQDSLLWREALAALRQPLRAKGIIAG